MRSRRGLLVGWAGLLMLAGCAASLYSPTEADVTPGATRQVLLEGRDLFVRKCGSCHSLPLPEAYPMTEWERHFRAMAPRARLSPEEKDRVWKFLLAGARHADNK